MHVTSVRQARNNRGAVSLPVRIVATGLFSGYFPIAPGTAGSLVGVALYLLPGFQGGAVMAAAVCVTFLAGVFTAAQMERELGEDPPVVVIDEVVGMWVALALLPKSVWMVCLSFLFFRVFDIVKPPPARRLERYRNGWGIMLDDVAAGIYANAAARLILFLFPAVG